MAATAADLRVEAEADSCRAWSTAAGELAVEATTPAPAAAGAALGGSRRLRKRCFDIAFSLAALVVCAPLLALIVVAVKLSSPGAALYSHQRVGRGGVEFRCWKFRTMVAGADSMLSELLELREDLRADFEQHYKLHDDPRVTAVGRFLRRTSLDELPQFFNVLRGDMSVIGPRPIVWGEAPLYGETLRPLLCVRPGVTGLWQVSGRNEVDYATRVALQLAAARQRSIARDAGVLVRTVLLMWPSRRNGAC